MATKLGLGNERYCQDRDNIENDSQHYEDDQMSSNSDTTHLPSQEEIDIIADLEVETVQSLSPPVSQVHKNKLQTEPEDLMDLSFEMDWEQKFESRPILAFRELRKELLRARNRKEQSDHILSRISVSNTSSDLSPALRGNASRGNAQNTIEPKAYIQGVLKHDIDKPITPKVIIRNTPHSYEAQEHDHIERLWQRAQSGSESTRSNLRHSKKRPPRRLAVHDSPARVQFRNRRAPGVNLTSSLQSRKRPAPEVLSENSRIAKLFCRAALSSGSNGTNLGFRKAVEGSVNSPRVIELEIHSKFRQRPNLVREYREAFDEINDPVIGPQTETPVEVYRRGAGSEYHEYEQPSQGVLSGLGSHFELILRGGLTVTQLHDPIDAELLEDECIGHLSALGRAIEKNDNYSCQRFVEFCKNASVSSDKLDRANRQSIVRAVHRIGELLENNLPDRSTSHQRAILTLAYQASMLLQYSFQPEFSKQTLRDLGLKVLEFHQNQGSSTFTESYSNESMQMALSLLTHLDGHFSLLQVPYSRSSNEAVNFALTLAELAVTSTIIRVKDIWETLYEYGRNQFALFDHAFLEKCLFIVKNCAGQPALFHGSAPLIELLNKFFEKKAVTSSEKARLAPINQVNYRHIMSRGESDFELYLKLLSHFLRNDPEFNVGRLRPISITEGNRTSVENRSLLLSNQLNLALVLYVFCSKEKSRPSIDRILGLIPSDSCIESPELVLDIWVSLYSSASTLGRLDESTIRTLCRWAKRLIGINGSHDYQWIANALSTIFPVLKNLSPSDLHWLDSIFNDFVFYSLRTALTEKSMKLGASKLIDRVLSMLHICLDQIKSNLEHSSYASVCPVNLGKNIWSLVDIGLTTENIQRASILEKAIDLWAKFISVEVKNPSRKTTDVIESSLSWSSFHQSRSKDRMEFFWARRLLKQLPELLFDEEFASYLKKCLMGSALAIDQYSSSFQKAMRILRLSPPGFHEKFEPTCKLRFLMNWLADQPKPMQKAGLGRMLQRCQLPDSNSSLVAQFIELVTELFPHYSHPCLAWTRQPYKFHPAEVDSFEIMTMRKNFKASRAGLLEGYLYAILKNENLLDIVARGCLVESHEGQFLEGWLYYCNRFTVATFEKEVTGSTENRVSSTILKSVGNVITALSCDRALPQNYEALLSFLRKQALDTLAAKTTSPIEWDNVASYMQLVQTFVLNMADKSYAAPLDYAFLQQAFSLSRIILLDEELAFRRLGTASNSIDGSKFHAANQAFRCILNLAVITGVRCPTRNKNLTPNQQLEIFFSNLRIALNTATIRQDSEIHPDYIDYDIFI